LASGSIYACRRQHGAYAAKPQDSSTMQKLIAVALLSAAAMPAQDFLFYKFDSSCIGNTEVINFAAGPQAWPDNGMLEENTGAPWASGIFGGSLAGGSVAGSTYNRVDSGWTPSLQPMIGDITIAYFVREATPYGTALPYLLGCDSGFRLFTGGAAGTGLIHRNIVQSGGAPAAIDCQLPAAAANFQALAAAGWVHIALV